MGFVVGYATILEPNRIRRKWAAERQCLGSWALRGISVAFRRPSAAGGRFSVKAVYEVPDRPGYQFTRA